MPRFLGVPVPSTNDRLASIRAYVESRPDEPFPRYGLAMEYAKHGLLTEADAEFQELKRRHPDYIATYYQHGRTSGLFITPDDVLFSIDSESQPANHSGWLTGVRMGPAAEDRLTGFIPPHDSTERALQGVAGEGVAVDADGHVFAAEGPASRPVAGSGITKYVRR